MLHSNETRAPIANLLNSAQLKGTPYHSLTLHPALCSSVGMRRWTGTQTQVTNVHFASSMTHGKCNNNNSITLTQPLHRKYWMLVHLATRCRTPSSVTRQHQDMLTNSRCEHPRLNHPTRHRTDTHIYQSSFILPPLTGSSRNCSDNLPLSDSDCVFRMCQICHTTQLVQLRVVVQLRLITSVHHMKPWNTELCLNFTGMY